MAEGGGLKTHHKCILVFGALFMGIIIILITMSFGYVDYYNLALKRQKSTGRVFTDRSYERGRYFIGPDFEFKTYPAQGQHVTLRNLGVFTKDQLIVNVDLFFVYYIRPSQLKQLHQEYQLNYHSVIINKAIDAIKGAANNYTTVEFIMNRTLVEQAMAASTRLRIGGRCCEEDYDIPNCIAMSQCFNFDDIGLMSNVRHFFLTRIDMPAKVEDRYLREMILVQQAEEEKLKLQEAVERKDTSKAVKEILNMADETNSEAQANATYILTKANAESKQTIGLANSEGLKNLMSKLDFKVTEHKISYSYLKSLHESSHVNLAVDFNNYVIGGR